MLAMKYLQDIPSLNSIDPATFPSSHFSDDTIRERCHRSRRNALQDSWWPFTYKVGLWDCDGMMQLPKH